MHTNTKIVIITTMSVFAMASSPIRFFSDYTEVTYADTDGGSVLKGIPTDYKGEFIVRDGTKIIGDRAFGGCEDLTSVVIPDSVTNIMYFAFLNCRSLTKVTLPDSVETIGHAAFFDCSLAEGVYIGSGLRNVGEEAFDYNKKAAVPITTNDNRVVAFTISPSNRWLRVEDGKLVPIPQEEEQ